MSKTDQLYKIANHFVDIHVPDIILLISYLLWRINISSFCFCSNEVKLFFQNLIQIVLHTTLMLRWIIVWYLKSIDTRNEINVTSSILNTYFQTLSPFLKFIRIGRFIYISEVEIDDCVKFLSGLVTMNRQERFKLYKTNGARSGRYGGWVARR